ncbi:MAG: hypothetical protein AAGB22_13335 [Bacteroidota bacterium]
MNSSWIYKGLCILAAILVWTWLTMVIWNWIVPLLFNGPSIDFLQTLGLLALVKLLCLGQGMWRWGSAYRMKQKMERKEAWKQQWQQKMDAMSPEDRAKMEDQMQKCMKWPSDWCK